MPNQELHNHSEVKNLQSPDIQEFVSEKLGELRKRLLDLSRRNPLINIQFRPTSTSILRVVDELPDVLRFNLANGSPMRLAPLPALEEELPDEQTDEFLDSLYIAREEDEQYLAEIATVDTSSDGAEEKLLKIERALKDRIREQIGLPPRQTKEDLSLTQHAKNHGIASSYVLPLPEDEHEDGRHQDTDIQTLMLPDRLARVAKGILEKGRSFERETGVNVLHVAFGFLEWKDPVERDRFISPLLLLEIRIERKQSPRGAQFFVSGLDKVSVNGTLAQKLFSEQRLTMPEYESGSVEGYFSEIRDKVPKGWHWKVRREVAIGIFPSSKIAMYHDLDPEKRPIAANELVARLMASAGGGDAAYAEVYETDSPEISKKVPYLVSDADASQYSALVDIADGKNLSIEGPPGSGKSQSIVNLIAAALVDNKKILFVAEKLTALDVVKSRLEAASLGEFILPLQAGRGTREKIYESLEERLALGRGSSRVREDFQSRQSSLDSRRSILQGYLDAIASQFGATRMTVYQVIGLGIATAEIRVGVPKEVRRIRLVGVENFSPETNEALVRDAESFAERLGQIHRMPKLWLASNAAVLSRDDAEDAGDAAGQIAQDMHCFSEDFTASGLAPFLTSDPLSVDLGEIKKLLTALTLEAERMDPALVDSLSNVEHRRHVQTLCGQIQERRTIHARLARILRDPLGWNVGKRIDAARDFAARNGGQILPEKHRARVAELGKDISGTNTLIVRARALPASWTDRAGVTLRAICDNAAKLMAFPKSIRAIRRADESRQASSLAAEISDTARLLADELAQIHQSLPQADNHDPAQMQSAAQTIANSGVFRFLSSEFKSARNTYRNILGGSAQDGRKIMAQRLKTYVDWLYKRRAFECDPRFNAVFGDLFKGLVTNHDAISQSSAFHSCCQGIAKDDSALQQILETGDLSAIEVISQTEGAPELSLSELERYRATQIKLLDKEKGLLEEAAGHLGLFKDREGLELAEIDEIVVYEDQMKDLTDRIGASSAASVLGSRFAGVKTRTDILQVACALAETLAAAPDPALAFSILRSGAAPSLLKELQAFQTRRERIEKSASGLWTLLDLPSDLRSTAALHARISDLMAAADDADSLLDCAQLKRCEETLRTQGLGVLVDWVMQEGDAFDPDRLGPIVRAIIAKNMVNRVYQIHSDALQGYDGRDLDRIREEIVKKDRQLIKSSRKVIRNEQLANAQPPAGINIGKKSTYTNMSLIINEMNKKRNRIGVRELTRRAGQALLELKPCWMMSPLAVAQYLHDGIKFDLVVIDEASQMTPENAIGALSRARQAAIVGDTKQLPPTSFFQKMLDDGDTDEDLREDSESILDMANIAFMPIRQFRWHYRSRHSSLIQFSNQNMYKGELTIFPSAQEDHPDLGVELVEVAGVYKSRRNEIEARAIVAAAIKHMQHKPDLSLGICTMNSDQKDLILEEFERERDRNGKVQAYIARWEEKNDSLEEFFIKNLETIQGDERDAMFISTLYGPETLGGRVLQRFGPINSVHGHRRLNVLFTRAKRKMVTFTSLKPIDIIVDGTKNFGVQMFRGWLEYCKTGDISGPPQTDGETESQFEDYVARQIETMGCSAIPQVGVAGFRIDLGVRHPDWPYGYILGVECDGATYHSSKSSRDRDRLRQEVLEGLGWRLHRIWSTDWFRNPRAEIERLRETIEAALQVAKKHHEVPRDRTDAMGRLDSIVHSVEKPTKAQQETALDVLNRSSVATLLSEQIDGDLLSHTTDAFGRAAEVFGVAVAAAEPTASLGSKVTVENITDGGKEIAFTLIEGNNDPEQERVGIHTPLGVALIDAQVGDEVEFQVGSVIKKARVVGIQ